MRRKPIRQFKRASFIALADIRPNPQSPPSEAYVINFSQGGIAIYSKELLQGRAEMTLYLFDDNGRPVAETIWGKVAWKKKIGSLYAVGLRFVGLNSRDHSLTIAAMDEALRW